MSDVSSIILSKLHLENFRNHSSKVITFKQPITLIAGQNASGKTSIIEALVLLALGESFRASKVEEMISFDQELSRIKAIIEDRKEKEQIQLEILLTRGIVQGKRSLSKLYSVNQVRRRKKDFIGKIMTVSFRPEDMRLVEGSPSRRRDYLDSPLAMTISGYAQSLKVYEQALKKRNRLLLAVREGEMPRTVLHYWNLQLIKHGQVLQEHRGQFLQFFAQPDFPLDFSIEYQPSLISEARIHTYQDKAIAAGHTLIGPHKDDFLIYLRPKNQSKSKSNQPFDVARYGSRGQQRMAVLWLKVCELLFLAEKTGEQPLLLLDDILSELDHDMQGLVTSLLKDRQSIVTTTDPKVFEHLDINSQDYQSILFE